MPVVTSVTTMTGRVLPIPESMPENAADITAGNRSEAEDSEKGDLLDLHGRIMADPVEECCRRRNQREVDDSRKERDRRRLPERAAHLAVLPCPMVLGHECAHVPGGGR